MPQFVLLSPTSLVGLTLLALPLAAHLVSRRTRRVVIFPSTALLQSTASPSASWQRVRDWVVLALRCLAVSLLVLGASQLSLITFDDTPTSNQRATVLLIDDQLSTQLRTGNTSVFQELQTQADNTLTATDPSSPAAVVWSTDHQVTPTWTTDRAMLRQQIARHAPSYRQANMPAAWQTVRRLLREHRGPTNLIILTDRTADTWRYLNDAHPASHLPGDVRLRVRSIDTNAVHNIALSSPTVTPAAGSALLSRMATVMVINQGGTTADVTVRFTPPAGEPTERQVTLAAGATATLSFDFTATKPGPNIVRFAIDQDDFAPDNRALAIGAVTPAPAVAIIAAEAHEVAVHRLALATDTGGNSAPSLRLTHDELAAANLHGVEHLLVILDKPLAPPAMLRLEKFVLDGGQLILWPSGNEPLNSNAWPVDWPRLSDATSPASRQIAVVDPRHPISRVFTGPSQVALQHASFTRTRRIMLDDTTAAPLRFDDDAPAMAARSIGAGRVIAMAFEADATHSSLVRSGNFVALVQQMLATHSRRDAVPTYFIGQPLTLHVPADTSDGELTLPDGVTANHVTRMAAGHDVRLSYRHTDVPGVYTWTHDGRLIAAAAVNVPPSPTRFDRLPADALEAQLQQRTADDATAVTPHRQLTSLAGLCFLLALLCMAGELAIAMRRDG